MAAVPSVAAMSWPRARCSLALHHHHEQLLRVPSSSPFLSLVARTLSTPLQSSSPAGKTLRRSDLGKFAQLLRRRASLHRISRTLAMSTSAPRSKSDAAPASPQSPAHATQVSVVGEDDPQFWERIQAHQKAAARLPALEEARTLLERNSRGILSTVSQKYDGYPFGSSVAFAPDPSGCPLLAVSSLSPHTADLLAHPQCSLLLSQDFSVPAEPLLVILGDAQPVEDQKGVALAREVYLKRHPGAFWVDFGDFRFIRIQPRTVRITANIATFAIGASVSEFSGEDFCASSPDPISAMETPVAGHMNQDHSDALAAIAQHSLGVKVPSAKMLTLDRFGFMLEVPFKDQSSRIRIPFPREATSRKEVKDILVEMSKESKEALA